MMTMIALPPFYDLQGHVTRFYKGHISSIECNIFNFSSGLLYTYTCDWNYRPDHCMYGNNCGPAVDNGISVIHGNREVYHNNKQPFFKAIYTAMRDFKPGDDKKLLAKNLADHLHAVSDPYCGIMAGSVLKYPKLSLV